MATANIDWDNFVFPRGRRRATDTWIHPNMTWVTAAGVRRHGAKWVPPGTPGAFEVPDAHLSDRAAAPTETRPAKPSYWTDYASLAQRQKELARELDAIDARIKQLRKARKAALEAELAALSSDETDDA